MHYRNRASCAVVIAGVAGLGFACAIAPGLMAQGKTAKDGVYTVAQAQRGEAIYHDQCSGCHGPDLGGLDEAPRLAGADRVRAWDTTTLAYLVNLIQTSMPARAPGSLNRKQVTDIVAFLLQTNKFPAGETELADDPSTLSQITIAK